MVTAMKMLTASSYCLIRTLRTAEPSSSRIRGSLNCSRYLVYKGSFRSAEETEYLYEYVRVR